MNSDEIELNKELREKIVVRICRREREMFLQKDLSEPKQIEEIQKILETVLKEEARRI